MSNNVEEKILHGTTTVGIKAKDGIVLCADMRASAGYFIANNNTMKLQKIDEHAGLTLAGGVADAQNIVDILRYHSNLHRVEKQIPISIHSLARLCSLIFHQNRGYPFMADILVGGYDANGPALFNIDMFGSVEEKSYVTTGSGSPVAVSKNALWKFASFGIHSAKIFLASSSDFLIDSSVLTTILFFIILTRFEIVSLFSIR